MKMGLHCLSEEYVANVTQCEHVAITSNWCESVVLISAADYMANNKGTLYP